MDRSDLIAVSRGERPADFVIRNARVVNVFSGELEETDVAFFDRWVAGLGTDYEGEREIDVGGRYLVPGLIDAHVHIESSLATPAEFARAVLPRGTTTVISDPHEIANVHGLPGIHYMLGASEGIPLSVMVMASSCVPATDMATAGAALHAEDLRQLRSHPRVLGLAEVMNFPGVIHGDPEVAAKLDAFRDRPIDGHAPGVSGKPLNAYAAAGPSTDHECTSAQEALEKLRRGLFVLFRDATNARNLGDLLPILTPITSRRIALCTDDRQPPDLLDQGGIDSMVRAVIQAGVDPVEAIRLATLNPAEHFRLHDRGAVGPGRRADFFLVGSLIDLEVEQVYAGGKLVAQGGAALPFPAAAAGSPPEPSMDIDWSRVSFRVPAKEGEIRLIRAIPDQIVTGSERLIPTIRDGTVIADPDRDILKIAVVERHLGSGRVGVGFVTGVGLDSGALAGTVAHDHHNLIVIGAEDASMLAAARRVAEMGGGLCVARGERVLASLPLPIGGLMSPEPIEEIRRRLDRVVQAARDLGSDLHDPFMAMSFLGLEVIPKLKITDRGLVDVEAFQFVDLWT
jgi:adenine deaminase